MALHPPIFFTQASRQLAQYGLKCTRHKTQTALSLTKNQRKTLYPQFEVQHIRKNTENFRIARFTCGKLPITLYCMLTFELSVRIELVMSSGTTA